VSRKNELIVSASRYSAIGGSDYQALKLLKAAATLEPAERELWLEIGRLQYVFGLYDEVLESCSAYRGLGSETFASKHLEARVMASTGEFEKAREFYLAQDLKLADPRVCWEKALNDLYFGDYSSGWKGYEHRFDILSLAQLHIYPFQLVRWNGQFEKNGSILLHGEQGLGDEIMFAGFLNQLLRCSKASGTKIYLACTTPNFDLFSHSFPDIHCLDHRRGPDDVKSWSKGFVPNWLKQLPHNTKQLPLGSLPYALQSYLSEPRPSPYLRAIPKDVEHFRRELASRINKKKKKSVKIGLAWAANMNTNFGASKSIALPLFKEISLLKNIQLVGVQSPHFGAEAKEAPLLDMIDMSDQLSSVSKSAALMESLDLIISVDTSYCHLAGALAKPTLALLKKDHDWRFGPSSGPTAFYPTVKNVRQQFIGEWGSVLSKVREMIALMCN